MTEAEFTASGAYNLSSGDRHGTRDRGTTRLRVIEADFRRDPRWLEFLSAHRDALIYHHPGWLAALEEEYGRRCVALACEGQDGRFYGILPLLPTRGLPVFLARNRVGKRLSSLPRTPLAGPLAADNDAMKALLLAAVERVKDHPEMQLELKTTISGLEELVPGLQCVRWRDTYVRGLPTNEIPSTETIGLQTRSARACTTCESCRILTFGKARDNHQVRWAANKARKQGLSIRTALDEAELRAWYRLYLRVMRRNAVPPRSIRFFRQLWKDLRPLGHMELLLAEGGDPNAAPPAADAESPISSDISNPTGGSILLRYGHTVFWAFTGSDEKYAMLHATDLTLWHCLHDSCKLGYHYFDLGEVAESHPELSQFKAKWGTVLRPIYRYYYPACSRPEETAESEASSLLMSTAVSLWRRLPLPVIARIGDWIFSYL